MYFPQIEKQSAMKALDAGHWDLAVSLILSNFSAKVQISTNFSIINN